MSASDEACCAVTAASAPCATSPAAVAGTCVECGAAGSPVERRTLLHMLVPDGLERVGVREYRFCAAPGCDVVYFSTDGVVAFGTADLRQRVGLKAGADPSAPVCYCFGFTAGDLEAGVQGGGTEVPARIRALVKERLCACEVRNPSGRCCLGEIARMVKRLSAVESSCCAGSPCEDGRERPQKEDL